jgi:LAO/AO transport system kinase
VRRRRRLTLSECVEGIARGDRIVLARAITLIESSRGEDAELAQQIIDACLPRSGDAIRVGITGVPGAGKSTFIEALGNFLIDKGDRVAVLAVDPSSERSGGSILGDKTRMERLANSEMAFIRPSPAGGSLGGVARRTRETMILCEAAGFRTVLIETVGVGQSETLVHGMADFFLLLMISGAGDELQGIKRGIIEMADLLAINKADGDNTRAAERAKRELEQALHLFPARETGWTPPAVTCSSVTGEGISEVWEVVLHHRAQMQANGWFDQNRRQQRQTWLREAVRSQLLEQFRHDERVKAALPGIEQTVREGELSPMRAAKALIEKFRGK